MKQEEKDKNSFIRTRVLVKRKFHFVYSECFICNCAKNVSDLIVLLSH